MTREKTYLVTFSYDRPYPFSRKYTIKATNMGTALNRGFKSLRADEKGRHIVELTVNIIILM